MSLAGTLALGAPGPSVWAMNAQAAVPDHVVKAAFVYNFIKFVDWPAERLAASPGEIQLCLLGADAPFLAALAGIDGKSAKGRRIRVRSIGTLPQAAGCHVLAVAESEHRRLAKLLPEAEAAGILTVSDMEGFAQAGGVIGLWVDIDQVQFDINLRAARHAGLTVGSQLLRLARQVIRD